VVTWSDRKRPDDDPNARRRKTVLNVRCVRFEGHGAEGRRGAKKEGRRQKITILPGGDSPSQQKIYQRRDRSRRQPLREKMPRREERLRNLKAKKLEAEKNRARRERRKKGLVSSDSLRQIFPLLACYKLILSR